MEKSQVKKQQNTFQSQLSEQEKLNNLSRLLKAKQKAEAKN